MIPQLQKRELYPNVSVYSIKDCVLGNKEICSNVKDDFSRLIYGKELNKDQMLMSKA